MLDGGACEERLELKIKRTRAGQQHLSQHVVVERAEMEPLHSPQPLHPSPSSSLPLRQREEGIVSHWRKDGEAIDDS